MATALAHRGPDRTLIWQEGPVALGHALRATTPEAAREQLPLEHGPTGCVVTADIRLDNRADLLNALGLASRGEATGDAEIALEAYLRWGEGFARRLLGDFAIAIWDPRSGSLVCARDHMGMRQLLYHAVPGRYVAFGTEAEAVLTQDRVPREVNAARVADFLVTELEGIDRTSTFHEGIVRLPAAHCMVVSERGVSLHRYWQAEPGRALRPRSDAEHVEAFRATFDEAVRCRLRGAGVGSTLSGGVDSGMVAATAAQLLAAEGRGPLPTISATTPDPSTAPETRAIEVAQAMPHLAPTTIDSADIEWAWPRAGDLMRSIAEPFDGVLSVIALVYLAARDRGLTVMLDGVAGDTVLAEGNHLARLLRRGRVATAWHEAVAQNRFWQGAYPPGRELLDGAIRAWVPRAPVEPLLARRRSRRRAARTAASLLAPGLAIAVDVESRLLALERHHHPRRTLDAAVERASAIDHPFLVVARERYDRIGAAAGIEPRDPFTDIRVVELCIDLPDHLVTCGGWPKAILRRAAEGRLPDAVRWRRGKEHPGWGFTDAVWSRLATDPWLDLTTDATGLSRYVDVPRARSVVESALAGAADGRAVAYDLAYLATWLRRQSERPRPRGR